MKRSILALALLAAAGCASAQSTVFGFGILNGRGAGAALLAGTPALPGGFGGATPLFFAGNTVDGFVAGRNGFSSAVIVLTENTPRLHALRDFTVTMFNNSYDALLPTYQAIDPLLMRIAAPGAPLTVPIGATIMNSATQIAAILNSGALRLASSNAMPGLEGLSFNR
ncbi:hypothetical protein [Nevskia sp.]|uniref:hypothetical protein n=1 Tax=Nevskia sp. TaxID=1929292 RepID=UPI0025F38E38|nr:hypothetical protein [Nevskia sp.]